MDDIFYLCPQKLKLQDIADALKSTEEVRVKLFRNSNTIQAEYLACKINFILMDAGEFNDIDDRNTIIQNGIQSVVCISHHKSDITKIMPLIKILPGKFGGFIGNDSDGFAPLFDISNADKFRYE